MTPCLRSSHHHLRNAPIFRHQDEHPSHYLCFHYKNFQTQTERRKESSQTHPLAIHSIAASFCHMFMEDTTSPMNYFRENTRYYLSLCPLNIAFTNEGHFLHNHDAITTVYKVNPVYLLISILCLHF